MAKMKFLVEVDVEDTEEAPAVAEDIRKRLSGSDGEQHLVLMNWEPVNLLNPKVTPLDSTQLGEPSYKKPRDIRYAAMVVEQTRQKIYAMPVPAGADSDEVYEKLEQTIRNFLTVHDLDFTDAPVTFYQLAMIESSHVDERRGAVSEWSTMESPRTKEHSVPVYIVGGQQ